MVDAAIKVMAFTIGFIFMAQARPPAVVFEKWKVVSTAGEYQQIVAAPVTKMEFQGAHIQEQDIHRAAMLARVNPILFKAVVLAESGGRTDLVSSRGAIGPAQLMPGTANDLAVNPYNARDNLRGGAMYLRQQLDVFGDKRLALAAYNAGPETVRKYRGVPPYQETRRYIRRVLVLEERLRAPANRDILSRPGRNVRIPAKGGKQTWDSRNS